MIAHVVSPIKNPYEIATDIFYLSQLANGVQSQQAISGTNAVKYPNDPKPRHTCRIHKVASKLSVSANHQGTAHCTMNSPRKGAEQQHIMGALALLCQVRGPAARFLNPGNPILGFIVISNIYSIFNILISNI